MKKTFLLTITFYTSLLFTFLILSACGGSGVPAGKNNLDNQKSGSSQTTTVKQRSKTERTTDLQQAWQKTIRIVFLGDSLTEGLRVDHQDSYPSQTVRKINQRLKKDNHDWQVEAINAGLSGDTTIGGLNRLPWFLKKKTDFLFVALGANDGLRGFELSATESNLKRIIETGKESGATVLLTGMDLPINYGKTYRNDFKKIYFKLAKDYQLKLLPFLLKGVAGEEEYNQDDGIHPNPKGYDVVSDQVSEFLYPIISEYIKQKQTKEN